MIDFTADLSLKLGQVEDKLDGLSNAFKALSPQRPYPVKFRMVATGDATNTYTVLDCNGTVGGPPTGRYFNLRRLTITAGGTGGDAFTTLSGASVIMVIAPPGYQNNVNTLLQSYELVEPIGTIPNSVAYASDQLTLMPNEHLYLIIKSAGTGVTVIASGQFESFATRAYAEAAFGAALAPPSQAD